MARLGPRLTALIGSLALLGSAALAQVESANSPFAPYTGCSFPDGLSVVETAPLAPGVTSRTVQVINGTYNVRMVAGRRVMFAYPGEDFYANVKVEILPADGYAETRMGLIKNFEWMLASSDNSRNYRLKSQLNGFDIQGLDRAKREGGVLGVYLFFDNQTHTVTTIYFLNQEPPKRFTTMEQYASLRDRFLNTYTACIRSALNGSKNQAQ